MNNKSIVKLVILVNSFDKTVYHILGSVPGNLKKY